MPTCALPDQTLTIKHIARSNPASFLVVRQRDGKTSQPVPVISPIGFPVEGRPHSDLMRELQWYLETFLDYPFPPETEHAERVLKALCDWGEQAFRNLFDSRFAGRMFDAATNDYSKLHLRISSDDSRVLAWPWEALRDPELGYLAQTCQVIRQVNTVRDPQDLPESLPSDQVIILLVVARPYERDVRFRTLARPLVEMIEREKLSASVHLLRPPTFDQLRKHLREHPGHYHILHFDGHGAYSGDASGGSGYTLQGPEGKLVFETEDGKPDLIPAEKLSTLLRECSVPAVVLNACQSAMTSSDSNDPFASVAMALLKSGMRDVVAMAYSLYVSGAQQFLPAFYQRLFDEGSIAVAVKAGRQQMWQHDQRVCVRGEFPLQDWFLPVLYQQDSLNFAFAKKTRTPPSRESKLLAESRWEKNHYDFIGRDSAILELERAMRRRVPGILIQGLGGVGKTTLARGFLQWLDQTGGLEYPPFWFSFQEIRSAEYVFNRIGEVLLGPNFAALAAENPEETMQMQMEAIIPVLRENRILIVWDNFESVTGIASRTTEANLPEPHRELLAQFLLELRDGQSKIIITSRLTEEWLGPERRFLLSLGGLDREERWEYCNTILRDLGKQIDRDDRDLVELMAQLGGHPLAMRAVLPLLEKMSAGQVLADLRSNLGSFKLDADSEQAKLYAMLASVEQSLPEELRPLLTLLGMHEEFVSPGMLGEMAKQVDVRWSVNRIEAFIRALVSAGLVRDIGGAHCEMHPLLTSYLRLARPRKAKPQDADAWARAFVDIMAVAANYLTSQEFHEKRVSHHLHGQNLYHALAEAARLGMLAHSVALIQALASFATASRNFASAQRLCEQCASLQNSLSDSRGEAGTYHQLGIIAEMQRDLPTAERWYRKALAIRKKCNDMGGAAGTYHQLGMIAELQQNFRTAHQRYRKSLAISEKLGIEDHAAKTYHQLGIIAHKQGDLVAAEQWCRKAVTVDEKLDNKHGAAAGYHHLGTIALEQQDFATASQLYCRALAIFEKQHDEHGVASTYQQLGSLALEQQDWVATERWYRQALTIFEKQHDEDGAAATYHQLGFVALRQEDFALAEHWYRKALTVFEQRRDEYGTADTCHELGKIAALQGQFARAEQLYQKSLATSEKQGDEHRTALNYGQLGLLAVLQGNVVESGEWMIKSLRAFLRTRDQKSVDEMLRNLLRLYNEACAGDKGKLRTMWEAAGLGDFPWT